VLISKLGINVPVYGPPSIVTNYYIRIISDECERLIKEFDKNYHESTDRNEFSFNITKDYNRLLLIMSRARSNQHSFSNDFEKLFSGLQNEQNKLNKRSSINDTLYFLHEYLISLSLYVQNTYSEFITSKKYESEEDIYRYFYKEPEHILHEKYHSILVYRGAIRDLFNKNKYDEKETKRLLNDTIQVFIRFSNIKGLNSKEAEFNDSFLHFFIALENSIFLNTHSIIPQINSYQVFSSDFFTTSILENFKKTIKEKLCKFEHVFDAIDFIDMQLRKNSSYLMVRKVPQDTTVNSIPRMAESWLLLLKEHYQKNPSFRFLIQEENGKEKTSKMVKKNYSFSGKQFHSDKEIDDYLNDWLNCRVTLDQWLNFSDVDLDNILSEVPLSEKEQIEIDNHRFNLYNQQVETIFKNRFKSKFEINQDKNEKITVAKRDLALIEDFINGNIDSFKSARLETSFGIKDWEHTGLQFEHILKHNYVSENNHNINSPACYADAEAIIKYKSYLTDFLTKINDADVSSSTKDNKAIKNKSTKKSPVAYKYKKYNSNLPAIADMMRFLIKNKYLHEKTEITDFRKIFNDTKPDNPIVWIHGIESLKFFVDLLQENTQIFEKVKTRVWIITSSLFVDENNLPFDSTKFRRQQTPASANLLERAIEFLN